MGCSLGKDKVFSMVDVAKREPGREQQDLADMSC